jgi:ABC-2 type transport system ATP-binding protein
MDSARPRTTTEPIITSSGLRKAYGRVVALEGLDLEIPRAAIGLLGANGAGKSTFIRLLLGLHRPTSGAASVLGMPIGDGNGVKIRERVGYLPESDCLPMDIASADFVRHMAEMSGLPREAARTRAAETLYHCGVDEERFRRMRELSTGMKQRVKLAQAIVHDPELVFLDEPTNGMDPAGREDMLRLISRIYHELGIAVILSSHILEDIERVCDYVVMLDHGRLTAMGPTSELMEGSGDIVVEIDREVEAFASRLAAAGLTVSRQGSSLGVEHRDDAVFDLIRDTAADLDVAVRGLHVATRSLEEVYIRQVDASSLVEEASVQPAK